MPALQGGSPSPKAASPSLTVVSGPHAGQIYPIGDQLTIGRAPDNTIVLEEHTVSAHHARVMSTPHGFVVTDLQSTNGTRLNDVRVTGTATLRDGDVLRLGPTVLLRFQTPIVEAADAPALVGAAAAEPAAIPSLHASPPAPLALPDAALPPLPESPHAAPEVPTPPVFAPPPAAGPAFPAAAWSETGAEPKKLTQRIWFRVLMTVVGTVVALIGVVAILQVLSGGGGASSKAQGPAIAGLSPQDLYSTLLKAPATPDELPAGFAFDRTIAADVAEGPKQFHAVGVADLTLEGPDSGDDIFYNVYPTTTDARGRFNAASTGKSFKPTGTVAAQGFANPAKCLTATGVSAGQAFGATSCIVLVGNVEVIGQSTVDGNGKSGDNANALALVRAAIAHLQKIGVAAQTPGGIAALLAMPSAQATDTGSGATTDASTSAARTLFNSLLQAPVAANELPAGFGGPRVAQFAPSGSARAFRAVGEVDVIVQGADALDGFAYVVFPTPADARVGFTHASAASGSTLTGTVTPPGINDPANCINDVNASGQGETFCIAVSGNVQVLGVSILASGQRSGNEANAIALAKAGLTHLHKVQGVK